jgi:hypothetical protein
MEEHMARGATSADETMSCYTSFCFSKKKTIPGSCIFVSVAIHPSVTYISLEVQCRQVSAHIK